MNLTMTKPAATAAKPLQDKVSLVTGSTSGIGLGIARTLAEAGWGVILNGIGKPEARPARDIDSPCRLIPSVTTQQVGE